MAPRPREDLEAMGVMDPVMEEELRKNPRPPQPDSHDHLVQREHRAAVLRTLHHLRVIPGPVPQVKEEDRKIQTRDGAEITVRIYTPVKAPEQGSPLIVMFHEGGWSMGDLTDEEVNCRMFSRDLGAVCVNVDYRLAPEYKFPTGVLDSWDALKWAASNASSLHANPARGFVIGGGSAGGNITAVLSHLARDEHLYPPLTGQYLCVPALLPSSVVPDEYKPEYLSREHNVIDPVLNMKSEDLSAALQTIYQPDEASPLYVPFNHQNHKGLPRAYFQLCGLDPLRDEGLIYERVLREECGIETKLDVYPGYGHMFWTNFPNMDVSKKFISDTLQGMKWLLECKGSA